MIKLCVLRLCEGDETRARETKTYLEPRKERRVGVRQEGIIPSREEDCGRLCAPSVQGSLGQLERGFRPRTGFPEGRRREGFGAEEGLNVFESSVSIINV